MKEIHANVQPLVLGRLVQSLMKIPGFPGMSVLDCDGFGRVLVDSGQSFDPFISKKRIEIIVEDDMVDQVVGIIVSRAHTGRPGDGRIFLFDVLASISIRTGARHSGGLTLTSQGSRMQPKIGGVGR